MNHRVSITPIVLDVEGTCAYTSLSESTIQQLTRDRSSGFPQPRKLSGRRVGYLVRELDAWIESRPISDLLPPPNTGAKKPRASSVRQATQGDPIAA